MDKGANWAVNTGNPLLPSIPSRASVKVQPVMQEVFKDQNMRAIISRALDSRLHMPPGTAERIALNAGKSPQVIMKEVFKDPNMRASIPRALDSKLNMPPGMTERVALSVGKSPQYAHLRELFANH